MFIEMFNWMPVAALVDDKIFCVHGGLSPELNSVDQIMKLIRPTEIPSSGMKIKINYEKVLNFLFKEITHNIFQMLLVIENIFFILLFFKILKKICFLKS